MKFVQFFLATFVLSLYIDDDIYCQGLIKDSDEDYAHFATWDSEFDLLNLERGLTFGFASDENLIDKSMCVYSLLDFCPPILNQSIYNNCVGWAVAYYAMSTQLNYRLGIKNSDLKYLLAMSPNEIMFSKSIDRDYLNFEGTSFSFQLDKILSEGASYRLKNLSESNEKNSIEDRIKINSWEKVDMTQSAIEKIKLALFSGKPLVFGVPISDSFFNGNNIDKTGVLSKLDFGSNQEFQAMTVIGFNENIAGGSFEVVTSYGKEFGIQGRIYIPYQLFLSYVNQIYIFDLNIPSDLLNSLSKIDLGKSHFSDYSSDLNIQIEWNGGDVIYVGEFNNDGKRSGFGALISGETIVLYDDYPHEYKGDVDQRIEGFDDFYNFISILGE